MARDRPCVDYLFRHGCPPGTEADSVGKMPNSDTALGSLRSREAETAEKALRERRLFHA